MAELAATPTPNVAQLDPYAPQVAQYQRNQRMADLLRQQAMLGIQVPSGSRASWTEGLAKILSGYLSRGSQDEADQGLQQITQQRMAAQVKALKDQGVPDSQIGAFLSGAPNVATRFVNANATPALIAAVAGQQPAAQPGQPPQGQGMQPDGTLPNNDVAQSQPMGMPQDAVGQSAALATYDEVVPGMGKYLNDRTKPQDVVMALQQQLAQAGIKPGDPRYGRAFADAVDKANYIAPVGAKAGETVLDPRTGQPTFYAPKADEGVNVTFDGQGKPSAAPIPGYAGAASGIAATRASALVPSEVSKAVQTAQGTAPIEVAKAGNIEAAKTDVDQLNKNWIAQQAQHQQAQTVKSYLGEIGRLGPEAIANPNSDHIAGALALIAPVSNQADKTLTAHQLVEKYQGQIVQRLSASGMSTDSARAIVQASTPGNHMTNQARAEAVANLTGASDLVQARTKVMAPYVQAGDRKGADAATTKFDSVADPRVFAYEAMSPAQKHAYAATLTQSQAADLHQRRVELRKMGVM